MALKDKLKQMTAKYGFTYRGFILATIAFPPAAAYIAWRLPGKPLLARLVLIALALTVPALFPILSGIFLYYIYSWVGS